MFSQQELQRVADLLTLLEDNKDKAKARVWSVENNHVVLKTPNTSPIDVAVRGSALHDEWVKDQDLFRKINEKSQKIATFTQFKVENLPVSGLIKIDYIKPSFKHTINDSAESGFRSLVAFATHYWKENLEAKETKVELPPAPTTVASPTTTAPSTPKDTSSPLGVNTISSNVAIAVAAAAAVKKQQEEKAKAERALAIAAAISNVGRHPEPSAITTTNTVASGTSTAGADAIAIDKGKGKLNMYAIFKRKNPAQEKAKDAPKTIKELPIQATAAPAFTTSDLKEWTTVAASSILRLPTVDNDTSDEKHPQPENKTGSFTADAPTASTVASTVFGGHHLQVPPASAGGTSAATSKKKLGGS